MKFEKLMRKSTLLHHAGLLLVFFLLLSGRSFGQDTTQHIPDGTEGEVLEDVNSDPQKQRWRDKRWRLFPGKFSTFKFGGGFLYEFAGFTQDAAGKRQTDSIGSPLENKFSVRDFRLTASGRFKTKREFSWKLGVMYDGVSDSWFIRESGLMIGVPELWGKFFIGRTKEGFSLNKVMVGYAGWAPERQMAIDVIPILADGVKWLAYLPKTRILWNLGIYNDFVSHSQSFSTYSWQVAARVGWLPVYSAADKKVLHLAVNYRYGEPVNGEIRVSSKPEANVAPKFIDTGKFSTDYSNHIGGEAYFSSGPLMIGAEIYSHRFNSATADDPAFFGGEVVVGYILTGESRPYIPSIGILGFVPVSKSVFKGGPGAWEVLLRATSLDLNGGTIQGGKFWRITPMVNWYLSKDIRFELAYGYGVLDRFELKGATQFYQARISFTLL